MKKISINKRAVLVSLIMLMLLCALSFAFSLKTGAANAEAPVYEVTGINGVIAATGTTNDAFYVNASSVSESVTGTWYIQYGGAAKKNGADITVTFRIIKEENRTLYFEGLNASEGDVISVGGIYPITNVIAGCPVTVAVGDYSVKLQEAEFVYNGNNVWGKVKTKVDEAPADNLVLDANGADVAIDDCTVANDNTPDVFGNDGSTKMLYTPNGVESGSTLTVTLGKRYLAKNFASLNIKMVVGSWGDESNKVTCTAYATSDTEFANPAGSVQTGHGNPQTILEMDAAALADSEGYIGSFVIRKTETFNVGGQMFFDYVELILDRKDDTVYESSVILPIDGNSVIMNPGSYGADDWNFFGDDKTAVMAYTENIGNGTVLKFSLTTKYKAANFIMLSVSVAATNWTAGNVVTTTMYALSDTEFTAPLASVTNSTESNGRADINVKAEELADADGYIGGFYLVKTQTDPDDTPWQFFAGRVSLVPSDPLSDSKYIATGYFGEGIADENEHWTTKLQKVNGWTDKDGKYEPKITVDPDKDAVNGYVFKVGFHSWFHTIAQNAIIFNRPISLKEAEAGIIIRIKAHLSPNGVAYSTTLGGIRFYSLDSDGMEGQGYMLPESIVQDEFILLYLNGTEASVLANADGYIYGMQIGAAIQRGDDADDFYIGDGIAYIAIDYVELRKTIKVNYYNATENGETKTGIAGSGFGSETIYISPTDGETRKFFGWVKGGDESAISLDNFYDFSQALDNDVDLYGWWVNAASGTDYYGLYKTADGKSVKIYSGGIELDGYADYEKIILSSDGKLYIKREIGSEILDITDASAFTKSEFVEITFKAFGKEVAFKAMTEGETIDYTFAPDGYKFKNWTDENGTEVSVATSGVTVLYAVCERAELAEKDYAEHLGIYLNRKTGDILELKENNAAVITFADGTTKNITYYLLESGGFAYIDGETETPSSFDANRVLVAGETEYAKLTSYTVTFYVDGAEYASATVNGGDYKVAAPENDPVIDGYEFVGWFTEVRGGEEYDFDRIVFRNMSLYAQFRVSDKPDDKPDEKPEEKSGCGSTLSGAGLFALAILPIAFAVRKKKFR